MFIIEYVLLKTLFFSFLPAALDITATVTQLVVTDTVLFKAGHNIVHCRFSDVV